MACKTSLNDPPEGVEVANYGDGSVLPLIIRALEGKDSVEYLRGWISVNRSWLEKKMLEHGKAIWAVCLC